MDETRDRYVNELLGGSNHQVQAEGDESIAVVTTFLAALEDLDVDAALALADPQIVYQNVPLPPARGIKAFERQMRLMARYGSGFRADIHNIAANGPVVLTERTDILEAGPWRASFWVCGTFEVRDGLIYLWRDYFDYADVTAATLRGLGGALLAPVRRLAGARSRLERVRPSVTV